MAPAPDFQHTLRKLVYCEVCGNGVHVGVSPRAALLSVWEQFLCPHCEQPNFHRLPGHVIVVSAAREE
jgi:hypothetical protein